MNFVKTLADGLGGAALADIYAPPALTKAVIKTMAVCNSTAGAVALTVKVQPQAGGTLRTVISARTLAVNETYLCPELVNEVIDVGGKIQLSGLNLEYVLSGLESTS